MRQQKMKCKETEGKMPPQKQNALEKQQVKDLI